MRRAAHARREHALGGFLTASAEAIGASLLTQGVSLDPLDERGGEVRAALQARVVELLSLLEDHVPSAGVATVAAAQDPPHLPAAAEPLLVSVDLLRDEGGVATVSAAELDVLGQGVTLALCNGGALFIQGFEAAAPEDELGGEAASLEPLEREVRLAAWELAGGVDHLAAPPQRLSREDALALAARYGVTPPSRTRWV